MSDTTKGSKAASLAGAGDGITANRANWQFDDKVAEMFSAHVIKSVPLYLEVQDLVASLSDWFVTPNSAICDIGCSTGTTLEMLYKRHLKKEGVKLYGIDRVSSMIERAKANLKGYNEHRVEFLCRDILAYEFPSNLSLALSLYTLQFINPAKRLELCRRIYNSLNVRGSFLLVEKVIDADSVVADMFALNYWEKKRDEGFEEIEIFNKAQSLRGVLTPLTPEENLSLLKEAGFSRITTFFRWCNFIGFVAIK